MKYIFIIIAMIWVGVLSGSPLEKVKLSKGMKREKAEELIANSLDRKSEYNVYSMNREKEEKYSDDETLLIVTYKPGFPATWVKNNDGTTEHLPPIDAEVKFWEILKIDITNTELKKFLKTHSSTSNEYETHAATNKFFSKNRVFTDEALAVLKPHLQKEEADVWKYHIVFIHNPGFTFVGHVIVDKKTKRITQTEFTGKKKHIIKPKPKTMAMMTSEQAYQVLAKTKLFGFGVKMGQKKSRDTDQAYGAIIRSPDEKRLLLKLCDEKNIYSKLFALCALFHLDHKAFLEKSYKLDKEQKIRSRLGCVYDEPTVGKVIDNIQTSKYEHMYQRPMKAKRIEKEKAKKLFMEYLRKNLKGKKSEEYVVNLKPFGNSTWLVSSFFKGIEPAMEFRNYITSKSEVKEINGDSLNVLFMNEYPLSAGTKEAKDKVIKDFLKVYSGERITIINKTSEIPDYDKKPIDEDLAPAIRTPYMNKDGITVVYTYQKIGGIVRRFRFHWTKDQRFRKVEVAKLATDIGAADYYE